MRTLSLLLCTLALLSSCEYQVEDAADVNQERIEATYCTVFNGTRGTTKAYVDFKFGRTPLQLSNPLYFETFQLYEEGNAVAGLYYSRQLQGIESGAYLWIDEESQPYENWVDPYPFELINPPIKLSKYTYIELPWEGELIPYEPGRFTLHIQSQVNYLSAQWHSGSTVIQVPAHVLDHFPEGKAVLTITRSHEEPIDQGTTAGGRSEVQFVQEYTLSIIH